MDIWNRLTDAHSQKRPLLTNANKVPWLQYTTEIELQVTGKNVMGQMSLVSASIPMMQREGYITARWETRDIMGIFCLL